MPDTRQPQWEPTADPPPVFDRIDPQTPPPYAPIANETLLAERLRVTLPVLVDEYGLAGVIQALAVLYPEGIDDASTTTIEGLADFRLVAPTAVELPGCRFVNPEGVACVRPYETTTGWAARVDAGPHAIMFDVADQAAAVALVRELVAIIWPEAE